MSKKTDTGFTPKEISAITSYRSNPNRQMIEFAQYFDDLDKLRANKEIPTKYVSFEVMKGILAGLSSEIPNQQLNGALPATLGDATVSIPLSVLRDLVDAWDHYCNSPKPNFAKSFGFGGTKHERTVLTKLEQIKSDRYYARRIIEERLYARAQRSKMSLAKAYEKVAETEKVSIETLKRAYRKHRAHWETVLNKHDLSIK